MHSSTREFCVEASLTIQPMFKANTPPVKAFSVRHARLLSLSVGGLQDNCEISDYIVEALDEFPVKFNSVKVLKQVQDESSVVPYEPHAEGAYFLARSAFGFLEKGWNKLKESMIRLMCAMRRCGL